ncbi:MAG: hypothetical protein EA343_01895 [Nodularia sp. (in: Bacteria)]|nr:MAG: hypothetical protein EA343_01895 [Nodularia sp. (in: cyanobacteria)]
MSIPNEREITNSEVKQESFTDPNGNTHTHRTRTAETNLAARDENNTIGGLLLGIIVTSLLSMIIGGVWYFNQSNKAAVENTVPSDSSPTTSPSSPPQTTIIEKTREVPVFVPVPQQQVITPSTPRQPDINITVPPQQPAAEKTPSATEPTPNPTESQANPTNNTSNSQNEGGRSTAGDVTDTTTGGSGE